MKSPKKISNTQIADLFKKIADMLEIKGEIIYKILAYRKASESIYELNRDVSDYWELGQLKEIPGVGKAIAEKIDELLSTGKLEFFEELCKEVPESLVELLRVPDLGPKKVAILWKNAGILNISDLYKVAKAGEIRYLPGFGEKSEQKIILGINSLTRQTGRIPIGKASIIRDWLTNYLENLPGVLQMEFAGSLRRRKETIGDLDVVIATKNSSPIMNAFVNHPDVIRIVGHGEEKSSVEFEQGIRVQLWCTSPDRFGTTLQYATGSKEHNVKLREFAKNLGYSLSEHSFVMEDGTEKLFVSEAEVYNFLGLSFIPPELREDRGEIFAARNKTLPNLVDSGDFRSEFHVHTKWSDGKLSIREMADEAILMGIKILAITDHSRSLGVAGGLSIENLAEQRIEIDKVSKEFGDRLILLQGSEVEIFADGSLDYPDEVLRKLDIVIASLHSGLRQPREKITERLIKAIKNPNVDLIGHPTGRMIPEREGADLDMDAIFSAVLESGTALEINAHPARLDLNEVNSRQASDLGIPLMINTDAHGAEDFKLLDFGVGIARRAWLDKERIINCWETEAVLSWLRGRTDHAA